MDETKLREAFAKIREDMDFFHSEIEKIKTNLEEHKKVSFNFVKRTMEELKIPTQNLQIPTLQHSLEAPKPQYLPVSTGNNGVPTNKPTNQQTIQHPPISHGNQDFNEKTAHFPDTKFALNKEDDKISQLQRASQIIESLDELKREVRFKFKKLTNQEMLVFSVIYQLEEQNIPIDYTVVAEKTGLSEISVRDYVRKVIKKGIPITKTKRENNKIALSIQPDLKKIASLNTIIQLREL